MNEDETASVRRYPLESRDGELERLRVQSEAMEPEAALMLERIGVCSGWRCLDVGCGPFGIARLLSPLAGAAGQVVGLDQNPGFLDQARKFSPENLEYRLGDAYATGFPTGSFDLVHMRFLASTAGAPERLLREAMRVVCDGGVVAMQEPDGRSLHCHPPHPAWDRLKAALLGSFEGVGADLRLARRLYALAVEAGLADVQYKAFLLAVRSRDAMVDYLPSTVESLRGTVVRLGLEAEQDLDQLLRECRLHLEQKGSSFTMYTVAQVWGWKR